MKMITSKVKVKTLAKTDRDRHIILPHSYISLSKQTEVKLSMFSAVIPQHAGQSGSQ